MKISVIIPIYNVAPYLERAINSVVSQSHKDLEIILINDGSTDNSPEIIDNYKNQDSRVIAIHKENKGYGHTVNTGLNIASGDYIAILEPDDYIDKEMYSSLLRLAKEYNADVVKSGYFEHTQTNGLGEDKRVLWRKDIPEQKPFQIKEFPYFFSFHPSIWTCMYKTSFLKENNIRVIEAPGAGWTDNLFQVQTLCLAKSIIYTSDSYYHWSRFETDASLELKDYRIPFIRTKEIHDWLKSRHITDPNILAALYRRELAYIRIVKGMKLNTRELDDANILIKEMCSNMDRDIVLNNGQFKDKEKEEYRSYLMR